jgi:glutamate/tyrosine decarboxylase-like PLP-dependent enzyme
VAREPLSFADRQRAILYQSEQRHWSVDRAVKILGLRPDQIHLVDSDANLRLDLKALAECVKKDTYSGLQPWVVVANAGATNAGTVDPLDDLASFCLEEKIWLHVDAAYGWSAALTADGQKILAGIARADSITLDPHKWFAQTFEAGGVLVRQGHLLPQTFCLRPEYMQDVAPQNDEVNFADYGIALTRRFRALKIWLSIKTLGISWFRRLIEHCCKLADFSQLWLEQCPDFEILNPRNLSIVCFRFHPGYGRGQFKNSAELDAFNLKLFEALRQTGRAFISTTRLRGQVALRFCFVNWRTTSADVEVILNLLKTLGEKLSKTS